MQTVAFVGAAGEICHKGPFNSIILVPIEMIQMATTSVSIFWHNLNMSTRQLEYPVRVRDPLHGARPMPGPGNMVNAWLTYTCMYMKRFPFTPMYVHIHMYTYMIYLDIHIYAGLKQG